MKKDYKGKYSEMFGPNSKNFFGSGVTMEEFMRVGMAERVEKAWFRQEKDERKRRLHFVTELSIELAKIKETITFCTSLAEMGIESIIEGDWHMVKEWADHFTFEEETNETARSHASVYARFRELLMQAYDTRPGTTSAEA